MSTNDNSDSAKSKIEEIRLDLEKKLAALEKAKQQTTNSNSDEISSEITENEVQDIAKPNEETADSVAESFVEQISNIEKANITEKDDVDDEDALFEISDEIENVEEEVEVLVEEKVEEKKETIVVPPVSSAKKDINFGEIESDELMQNQEVIEVSNEPEEEPKKSKLNFVIYGLLAILLLVVGYFAMDYMKGKNNLDSEKTKRILSEYENRRYQDSIRLLDAEKRLSEFESQKYIDSVANADRIQLINNSTVNTPLSETDKSTNKWSRSNVKPTVSKWSKDNTNVITNTTNSTESDINTTSTVDNSTVDSTPMGTDVAVTNDAVNTSSTAETPVEVAETSAVSVEKEKEIIKEPKKAETLTTIEKAPIYPGCAGAGSETAKKRCMITKINKFVNKNFNSHIAQDIGLKAGTQKINVKFIIDKNGYVNVSRVRASHPALKKEAIRVVNKLPKMVPGKSNGKAQNVNYFLPIIFNVDME